MKKKRRRSVEEISAGVFVTSLLVCALACASVAILLGRGAVEEKKEDLPKAVTELPAPYALENAYFLPATKDAGISYQDRLTFFGESTTAHLRSRGVLSNGTRTTQVLADESGTKRLSSRLPYENVIDPESGESVGLLELLEKKKPAILVLSFGLNGVYGYAAKPESFITDYTALLSSIQEASPNTTILLQTIYPVTKDSERFDDPEEVNRDIRALNEILPKIAAKQDRVYCVDTASVLKDEDGALNAAFDNGDGYHLNNAAYREILRYLRTHALEET